MAGLVSGKCRYLRHTRDPDQSSQIKLRRARTGTHNEKLTCVRRRPSEGSALALEVVQKGNLSRVLVCDKRPRARRPNNMPGT